jgi:AraC family transcriptional regulator
MPYECEVREIQSQPAIAIRATIKANAIGDTLGQIYPRVWNFVTASGGQPSGPPYARYYHVEPERVELEGGIPVATRMPADETIVATALPAGRVAVTRHIGPYQELNNAWMALADWIKAQGYTPVDAGWESYVSDPGDHSDPSTLITDVYWPIA